MIEALKNIYRYIKYKEQKQKIAREKKIKPQQGVLLKQEFETSIKKLIIFIVPGADRFTGKETISGGVISILSIAKETKYFFSHDKSIGVLVCTTPKDNLLLKYHNIENDFNVYDYSLIADFFKNLSNIVLHIPDCLVAHFFKVLPKKDSIFLDNLENVHINILNQNIKLMPSASEVLRIKQKYSYTTITTAHQQYCTKYYRNYFGVPLHKLSVWISPEHYKFVQKSNKENLLVYSPDFTPQKEKIVEKLQQIKGLKVQQIEGLTYSEFKNLISKAKWALTFGEGLDGYFIEPVFSGAISFAVYNEDFFTDEFKGIKTVYSSYEKMLDNITDDINALDSNNEAFVLQQKQQFDLCASLYSSKVYKENIEKFYNNQLTFN